MKRTIHRRQRPRPSGPRGAAPIELFAAHRPRLTSFDTSLGWMAIAWSDVLEGVVFAHDSRRRAEESLRRLHRNGAGPECPAPVDDGEAAPPWVSQLISQLCRFAEAEPIDFSQVPIAQSHLTPFGGRVIAACRRIGWGRVSSYGELAARCGAAGAARAVGSVMAKNRFPLVVPCHRVLAAGGKLGGYSAPGGLKSKRRLLEMEQSGADSFRRSTLE